MDAVISKIDESMCVGNRLALEGVLEGVVILVVDDDVATCELLNFFLGLHGAAVSTAFSADEGLQLFHVIQPDLLISDVCMPKATGHFLIQQIRASGVDREQVPAIALTALAAEQDEKDSLAAGFQRHITKPVDPDNFLTEILRLLRLLQ